MSRARRGISIIWVIFAVTLAGAAAITAFLQYLEAQTYKEWIKRAQEERDALLPVKQMVEDILAAT